MKTLGMAIVKGLAPFSLAIFLSLNGGCASLPATAVQRIQEADQAYRGTRYDAAEQLLAPVIESHTDKPETAEALYLRALCRIKTNRPTEALADLKKALYLTRRNDLVDLIHTQLGNLEFGQHRYKQAAVYYESAFAELPDRPPKDRVGFQYGVALQRTGRFANARSSFNEVAEQFPASKYAPEARRKAAWPHEYFSIQCGAFRNISGAHQHAESLKRKGVHAIALPDEAAVPRRYVVRVGRYPTYGAATRNLSSVRRVQSDAFVLP